MHPLWSGKFFSFFILMALTACLAGPGPSSDDLNAGGGGGGVAQGPGGNPATRPTPGFTEVEIRPATSTTLPAPATFLKNLTVNLDPLIEIHEVRLFVKNLNMQDTLSPGVEFPGPFLVRLIEASGIVDEAVPAFGNVVLPEGDYSQMDLSFEILDSAEIPPEAQDDPIVTQSLVDHSIVVEGHLRILPLPLPGLGDLVNFRFLSRQTPNLRVETPVGMAFFGQADPNHLFLAFKIKTWLEVTLPNVIRSVLLNLDLSQLIQILVNLVHLEISTDSPILELRQLALEIEANLNASLRFAPSEDANFDESDVQESSSSTVLP